MKQMRLARVPYLARLALALPAGAAGALAQAPVSVAPLILVPVFAGFLLITTTTRRRGAFGIGWAIAFGYFAVDLRWLVEPFQVEAEIYGWMAPFALALMASGLALFWGVGFAAAWRRGPFGLALCWALAEVARAYLFTGFPWAGLPQSLLDTPYQHLLAYIGPHGVTLLLLSLVALSLQSRVRAGLAGLIALGLGFGLLAVPDAPTAAADSLVVRVVQPNAPQHEKWDPEKWRIFFDRQIAATRAAAQSPPDLIIWPETAVPFRMDSAAFAFDAIHQVAGDIPVVLGMLRREDQSTFNALAVFQGGVVQESYDKHHLVPFGEYMPFPALFRALGIQALAQRTLYGQSPGQGPRVIKVGDLSVLPLICYEAVFPQHAQAPGDRPDVLMHLTNDAWFGAYAGPQQHLAQARMRAIEQGLPLVRAANTGISAIIDPRGGVVGSLGMGQHGFVDAPLPPALVETLYATTGDMPAVVVMLIGLGLVFLRGPREISN